MIWFPMNITEELNLKTLISVSVSIPLGTISLHGDEIFLCKFQEVKYNIDCTIVIGNLNVFYFIVT